MAATLELRQDRTGEFFADWQSRAAQSKVGKSRPEQALVMQKTRADGKLKKNEEQCHAISSRVREWLETHEHPRGALGMKHTLETKLVLGKKSREAWIHMSDEKKDVRLAKNVATRIKNGTIPSGRPNASWKAGWREIGGIEKYYRSRWEANFARYLEWLRGLGEIKSWEHESKTFWFEKIRRGCVSYLPDFHIIEKSGTETYYEVKGWMDDRSATKIKRMALYYPEIQLIVVGRKEYREIEEKVAGLIDGWEEEGSPMAYTTRSVKTASAPLVSQSVIDASDKLLADIEAKVNADPALKKKCDKVRKEALASIARAKKRELSNCSNEVISGEEYLRGKE
jgi:hypothetical protein